MKNIFVKGNSKETFVKLLRFGLAVIIFGIIIASIYIGKRRFGGNLSEGEISLSDLYAPFDFSIRGDIDEVLTGIEIKKAKDATLDIYDYDSGKSESKIKWIENLFSQLNLVKISSEADQTAAQAAVDRLAGQFNLPHSLIRNFLQIEDPDTFKNKCTDIINNLFDHPIISAANRNELIKFNKNKILIHDYLQNRSIEKTIQEIDDVESLTRKVNAKLDIVFSNNRRLRIYAAELLKPLISVNTVFNPESTAKYKEESAKKVSPVYQQIDVKKNELLIVKGQRVSKRNIEFIDEINRRLKKENALFFVLGAGIIVLILLIIVTVYLRSYEPSVYSDIESLFFMGILTLLIVVTAKIISLSSIPTYLIPLSSVVMLIAMLIGPTTALKMNLTMSILVSILLGRSLEHMIVFLIGGVAGVFLVEKARRRSQVLRAGFGVGLTQFICIIGLGLLNNLSYRSFLAEGMWGLLNGVVCSFITLGSLPVFEYVFRLVSNITLLELSGLNSPLLKEMIIKAPGTYHHSLIVGNLAETAAESIGANSLLARVGAYYHDIGKIDKAKYFSENQPAQRSKHSKLTPALSSLVIINHIKEGIEFAKKYKLNRKVIDLIEQHHGTSKVQFFYQRALMKGEDEKDIENRFCYPGPRPQSNEAAIVLLADSVEAASRTLGEPTPASIRNLVKRIINNKFIDGQLNDCSLNLKDINKINESFVNILTGIFHTRIKYPQANEAEENEDRNNKSTKQNSIFSEEDKNKDRNNS